LKVPRGDGNGDRIAGSLSQKA